MKKTLLLFALLFCLVPNSASEAAEFTLDSFTVTLRDSDPGLVLWEAHDSNPLMFSLTADGGTYTTDLFDIGTNELKLNWDDLVPYLITVEFNFSTPEPGFGGLTYGITGAAWLGSSFGYVVWDSPLLLSFGSTGLLEITLQDAYFRLGGMDTILASFDVLSDDVLSSIHAPEPSSLVLLGLGLAGIARSLRRRRIIAGS